MTTTATPSVPAGICEDPALAALQIQTPPMRLSKSATPSDAGTIACVLSAELSSVRIHVWPRVGYAAIWPNVAIYHAGGGKRGTVRAFSAASARRLRYTLLTARCDLPMYSMTLTIRDYRDPVTWRRNVDAWAKRVTRSRSACIWRVELQRRGTPHLHIILWSRCPAVVRAAWLSVWGVNGDPDHEAHAVQYDPCTTSAWYEYLAAHATKHKTDQLGWQGRQWGVVNRGLLSFVRAARSCRYDYVATQYALRLWATWLRLYRGVHIGRLVPYSRVCFDSRDADILLRCFERASRYL